MKITDEQINEKAIIHAMPLTNEYHQLIAEIAFEKGARWAIKQMQPIATKDSAPKCNDSDKHYFICAYDADLNFWCDVHYDTVSKNPVEYPFWFSYPEPPTQKP